jgi:hypothetical protein
MFILGIGNYTGDVLDIGFASHYNNGTNAHTGLIRDAVTDEWQLFEGYTPEIGANNSIDINDASFKIATLNANLKSTTITIKNIDLLPYVNNAYDKANSGASFANGAFVTANSGTSFANGAFVTANSAASFANGAFLVANSGAIFANGAFVTANSGASFANGAFVVANSASSFANGAFLRANASYTAQNTTADFANGSYLAANSGAIFANGAFARANAAYNKANTSTGITYTAANTTPVTATIGDQWYFIANDILYEYINDGTTSYWVDVSSSTLTSSLPVDSWARLNSNAAFTQANTATSAAKAVGYSLVFGG